MSQIRLGMVLARELLVWVHTPVKLKRSRCTTAHEPEIGATPSCGHAGKHAICAVLPVAVLCERLSPGTVGGTGMNDTTGSGDHALLFLRPSNAGTE